MDNVTVLGKGVHGVVISDGDYVNKTSYQLMNSLPEIFISCKIPLQYTRRGLGYSFHIVDERIESIIIMEKGICVIDLIHSSNVELDYPMKHRIINQLIYGLLELEHSGFIHGDIKLENVVLINDNVKIIDFGLVTSPYSYTNVRTQSYSIPEKIVNNTRAIYSVGILMCRLLEPAYFEKMSGNICDVIDHITSKYPKYQNLLHSILINHSISSFSHLLSLHNEITPQETLVECLNASIQFLNESSISQNSDVLSRSCSKVINLREGFDGRRIYKICARNGLSAISTFDAIQRASNLMYQDKMNQMNADKYEIACIIFSASLYGEKFSRDDINVDIELLECIKMVIESTYPHGLLHTISTVELFLFSLPMYHTMNWKEECESFRETFNSSNKFDEKDPNLNIKEYGRALTRSTNMNDISWFIYVDDEYSRYHHLKIKPTPDTEIYPRNNDIEPPNII